MNREPSTMRSSDTPVSYPESIQHVDQIFGRKVPGRAWSERTAAQPAGGTVERGDAVIETGEHVGEGGAAGVVEVQRRSVEGHLLDHGIEHAGNLPWMRDADGVADRNLEHAEADQSRRDPRHLRRCNGAFERTAKAGRQIPAHPDAGRQPPGHRPRRTSPSDWSIDWLMLRWLKVSDAAAKIAISDTPAAMARSSPARFGTSAV